MHEFSELINSRFSELGFTSVKRSKFHPNAKCILKRKTFNINRSIAIFQFPELPSDLKTEIKKIRKYIAFQCGFIPFFHGLGIQLIIEAPGIVEKYENTLEFVDKIDNQWAIIQSVFFIDHKAELFSGGITWGQSVSKPYHKIIAESLNETYAQSVA